MAQTQAELEILKYAYPPRFRKDMAQAQAELELVKSDQECQGIHPETLPIGSAEDAQRTHLADCSSKPDGLQPAWFCNRNLFPDTARP